MGRIRGERSLDVYMNGELTGTWTLDREHRFTYAESWWTSSRARSLSLSLPVHGDSQTYRGALVESFFDNLLPDSPDIRKRIQSRYGLASDRAFELLAEIGRDCVGAVQLLPTGEHPEENRTIKARRINDGEIESLLREMTGQGFAGRESQDFRISLAGAQEKTALMKRENQWYVPQGATPTTHILKLPLGRVGKDQYDLSTSVENEWLCSRIMEHYGMAVPSCETMVFGKEKVLAVERFDRRLSQDGSWIIRLPQEDICQATGRWEAQKYENEGGPGIRKIMNLLSQSQRAEKDRRDFFKAQIIFHLLAATDGHGKNFSLFMQRGDKFRLTPFYDVLSLHPMISKGTGKIYPAKVRMAMALTGDSGKRRYHWDKITLSHWLATGKAVGYSKTITQRILGEVMEQTEGVIASVKSEIPADFPAHVADSIFAGMERYLGRLQIKT